MKITFAGCGSFFAGPDQFQSNIVIEARSGKKLLFDCGTDAKFSIAELKLKVTDIDAVWISHSHADHAGGLEWLGFGSYFMANPFGTKRPYLFCNEHLMSELWSRTLRGGMESIQGKLVDMTEYFNCMPIKDNGWFWWEGIAFDPVQTVHVVSGRMIKHSYGLMFYEASKSDTRWLYPPVNVSGPYVVPPSGTGIYRMPPATLPLPRKLGPLVYITADTKFCPHVGKFCAEADVVFHDCETAPYNSGVHAAYNELKTLPDDVKKKMWLYHYQPKPEFDAAKDGFLGFVNKGQVFEFPLKEKREDPPAVSGQRGY